MTTTGISHVGNVATTSYEAPVSSYSAPVISKGKPPPKLAILSFGNTGYNTDFSASYATTGAHNEIGNDYGAEYGTPKPTDVVHGGGLDSSIYVPSVQGYAGLGAQSKANVGYVPINQHIDHSFHESNEAYVDTASYNSGFNNFVASGSASSYSRFNDGSDSGRISVQIPKRHHPNAIPVPVSIRVIPASIILPAHSFSSPSSGNVAAQSTSSYTSYNSAPSKSNGKTPHDSSIEFSAQFASPSPTEPLFSKMKAWKSNLFKQNQPVDSIVSHTTKPSNSIPVSYSYRPEFDSFARGIPILLIPEHVHTKESMYMNTLQTNLQSFMLMKRPETSDDIFSSPFPSHLSHKYPSNQVATISLTPNSIHQPIDLREKDISLPTPKPSILLNGEDGVEIIYGTPRPYSIFSEDDHTDSLHNLSSFSNTNSVYDLFNDSPPHSLKSSHTTSNLYINSPQRTPITVLPKGNPPNSFKLRFEDSIESPILWSSYSSYLRPLSLNSNVHDLVFRHEPLLNLRNNLRVNDLDKLAESSKKIPWVVENRESHEKLKLNDGWVVSNTESDLFSQNKGIIDFIGDDEQFRKEHASESRDQRHVSIFSSQNSNKSTNFTVNRNIPNNKLSEYNIKNSQQIEDESSESLSRVLTQVLPPKFNLPPPFDNKKFLESKFLETTNNISSPLFVNIDNNGSLKETRGISFTFESIIPKEVATLEARDQQLADEIAKENQFLALTQPSSAEALGKDILQSISNILNVSGSSGAYTDNLRKGRILKQTPLVWKDIISLNHTDTTRTEPLKRLSTSSDIANITSLFTNVLLDYNIN